MESRPLYIYIYIFVWLFLEFFSTQLYDDIKYSYLIGRESPW